MDKPIIFFVYSNSATQFLQQLKDESWEVAKALQIAYQYKDCELVREESINKEKFRDSLQNYSNRMHILHFSGHGGGKELEFEDGRINSETLNGLLQSSQENLKMVFLNACNTYDMAEELLKGGVSIVVATKFSVQDRVAKDFARIFYEHLSNGNTINDSFDFASTSIMQDNNDRYPTTKDNKVIFRSSEPKLKSDENEFPWLLIVKEGKEADLQWRIPEKGTDKEENTKGAIRKILESQVFPVILFGVLGSAFTWYVATLNNVNNLKWVKQKYETSGDTLTQTYYIYSIGGDKSSAEISFGIRLKFRPNYRIIGVDFTKKNSNSINRLLREEDQEYSLETKPLEKNNKYILRVQVHCDTLPGPRDSFSVISIKANDGDKNVAIGNNLTIEDHIRLNFFTYLATGILILFAVCFLVWKKMKPKKTVF